jgi:membrane associated rhomboid family serine protease
MIIIPTGTDAPIYHWPYATVAFILINIAVFFVVPPSSSDVELDENDEVVATAESNFDRFALSLGDGKLHPMQWVTHNFLHYGFMHLLGNLIFLWAFGIVVEGKLGVFKYVPAYLVIGTLHGFFVQLIMMKSSTEGHAAGASAMVYGLLAVCMIWAPRNELNLIFIMTGFGFRVFVRQFELYFTTVALWYIGEQVLSLVFWGTAHGRVMVSELGHLSGALWGAVVGVVLLKAGLVDCEGWDVFSLLSKQKVLARKWKERGDRLDHEKKVLKTSVKARTKARRGSNGDGEGIEPGDRSAAALKKVHALIEQGDYASALAVYDKSTRTLVNWPSQPDLHALIKAMHARKAEVDSIRLMRDHCRQFPDTAPRVPLKLAQILLRDRQRPGEALRVLAALPAGSLPADLESVRGKLVRQAELMQEEGVLELEGDD